MVFGLFKTRKCYESNQIYERNRNFKRLVYKTANFFCITPWYDFEKNELKKPVLNKILAMIYCLFLGILLLFSVFYDNSHVVENIFEKVLLVLSRLISIVLTECLIFGSTFIRQHTWGKFLRKISVSSLECMEQCCGDRTILWFYLQFFLGHVFFFACFSYHAYIWYVIAGQTCILPFVSIVIQEYYCFLFVLVASNTALVIKYLYEDLGKLLEKNTDQYCLKRDQGGSEEKFRRYILEVGKQYRYISELVDYYNKIFGWISLLIFWQAIIQLLRSANFILSIMDRPIFSWQIFFSIFSIALLSMVEAVCITLSCETASSAGEKLKRISHKLQENFDIDSPCRRELFNLADIVRSHKPKFTAANFFLINKGTTLGIINIATTYLIVIIEFNAKMHDVL